MILSNSFSRLPGIRLQQGAEEERLILGYLSGCLPQSSEGLLLDETLLLGFLKSTGPAQKGKTVYLIVEKSSQPPPAQRDVLPYEGRVLKLCSPGSPAKTDGFSKQLIPALQRASGQHHTHLILGYGNSSFLPMIFLLAFK